MRFSHIMVILVITRQKITVRATVTSYNIMSDCCYHHTIKHVKKIHGPKYLLIVNLSLYLSLHSILIVNILFSTWQEIPADIEVHPPPVDERPLENKKSTDDIGASTNTESVQRRNKATQENQSEDDTESHGNQENIKMTQKVNAHLCSNGCACTRFWSNLTCSMGAN